MYSVLTQTAFFSLIAIPSVPILSDRLTACIIGGLLAGAGVGLTLRAGGSGGGNDIIGLYMAKKYESFSVGRMTLIINGIIYLICAMLFELPTALYSIIYGIKHKGEIKIHKFSLRNLWLTFKDAIWALLMPVIILGGIYGGIFTPTESAAVAILYGLIVSKFIYHELDFAVLKDIMSGAIKTTCQIMFIVCSATAFAYVLTRENVTANMAKALIGAANSTVMFWLLVTILLLIVGCIMDTVPAIMILAPLFALRNQRCGIWRDHGHQSGYWPVHATGRPEPVCSSRFA